MNERAIEALDAYLDASRLPVPHALLVDGPWGSGKTYFLQNIYEPYRRDKFRKLGIHCSPFLFVSLFGAKSALEVEKRIYKAACPGEAFVGALAGDFALGVGEFFKVKDATKSGIDRFVKNAIRRINDFVFVLDDIERIDREAAGEILGLINMLLTQNSRRVILVSNENVLMGGADDWKTHNEKVIGRRVRVYPNIVDVVSNTISDMEDSPSKSFMAQRFEKIVEIAVQSNVENLRNLIWAISNARSFVQCFAADKEIPDEHTERTMLVVIATTLFYRSGLLEDRGIEELSKLTMNKVVRLMIKEKSSQPLDTFVSQAEKFHDTFLTLNLENPPIDFDCIRQFERSGYLNFKQLLDATKSRFGFGPAFEQPAWRKLWGGTEGSFEEVDQAIDALARQLEEKQIVRRGIILHAAGLAIKFEGAEDQRITKGAEAVSFFESYIAELEKSNLLEPVERHSLDSRYDAYDGLGFTSIESDQFKQIDKFLRDRLKQLSDSILSERVETIVSEAERGDFAVLYKFFQGDDFELLDRAALKDVAIDRMVDLLTQSPIALSIGTKLLAYRYNSAHGSSNIFEEIPWARKLYVALIEKIDHWKQPNRTIAKHSLESSIRYYDAKRSKEARILSP